jgi:hypothetical protein
MNSRVKVALAISVLLLVLIEHAEAAGEVMAALQVE